MKSAGAGYFFAELEGERIGQIGFVEDGSLLYLRAFGIVPARRRRGYGRRLLATTLHQMLAEGRRRFALDVATDNKKALALYRSCGFRETDAYDYHDAALA